MIEAIKHVTVNSSDDTWAIIFRWFTGGGLTAVIYGVFRYGKTYSNHATRLDNIEKDIGEVKTSVKEVKDDIKDDVSDIKDDVRDLRAAIYGYPPRNPWSR